MIVAECKLQIESPKRHFPPPLPPHTTLPPLDITGTFPCLQQKRSVSSFVARSIAVDKIDTRYNNWLHVFTAGSTSPETATSTAAFVIPSIGVQQAGRLNVWTTSTTAELWISSRCDIKGNEEADFLLPQRHIVRTSQDLFIPRFSETRRLVHMIPRMRHPYSGVAVAAHIRQEVHWTQRSVMTTQLQKPRWGELIEEGNAPSDAESLDADFKTVSSRKSFKRKKGRQNGNSSNSTEDTILSQPQRQTGLTVIHRQQQFYKSQQLAVAPLLRKRTEQHYKGNQDEAR
ncbi:hypothetical protein HPB47_014490 [Ixodes persulcatus]|uniref:Uncharacterized protein n=1 Tax=Ixodes persulcatus TaxID=34615 RepID=A0AC60QW00_IXOPE|nr:hypothetical protein HPB47_014490 [Ixodes persulcatus]